VAKSKKPAARPSARSAKPSPAHAKATRPPPGPVLRPVPLYEFTAGGLAGQVRLADPGRGLDLIQGVEGKVLPAVSQEVLSLRHYLSRGDSGLLAPREEAACEGKVEKHGVVFSYDSPRNWPVTAVARYELRAEGGADATFTFRFTKALKGFEAGVETLMPRSRPGIYVHSGGQWTHASAGPQSQRFYPRNLGAAELIVDGRWDGLRLGGAALSVEPRGYDYPMLVVRDERSGWALVYMALTEECSSVWVNSAQRSIGFGLVGGDVKAQSSAVCRLRVALCQANRLADVLPHYRAFVQEARAARR